MLLAEANYVFLIHKGGDDPFMTLSLSAKATDGFY